MSAKSKRKLDHMVSSSPSNLLPSTILRALSTSLPPNTFVNLLSRLYPTLDALPELHRTTVSNALAEIQRDSGEILRIAAAVNYDTHKKSLEDTVKALNKSYKRIWKYSDREQEEITNKFTGEVLEWLPILWRAIEHGLELDIVQKCLLLCTETVTNVKICTGSDWLFGDEKMSITDSKGVTIYEGRDVSDGLHWMWGEILVTASAQGAKTKYIESDIERLEIQDGVYRSMRIDEQDKRHDRFWDAHWTPAMKEAASRFITSHNAARIASFEKAPTLRLYRELVREFPDLKSKLLQATRARIFPSTPSSRPTITYGRAANIFQDAKQRKDLVRLLNALPGLCSNTTIQQAEITVITHLVSCGRIRLQAPERQTILDAIARGLIGVKQKTLDNVSRVFPGFEVAHAWLKQQVDDGKVTHEALGTGHNYLTNDVRIQLEELDYVREKYLSEFLSLASRGSDELDSDGSENDEDNVDSDDSDDEDDGHPNLAGEAARWVWLLKKIDFDSEDDWWDEVKESDTEGSLLFEVDGVAEILISRCETRNRNGKNQYLANGLRAIYRIFTAKNGKERPTVGSDMTSTQGVHDILIEPPKVQYYSSPCC